MAAPTRQRLPDRRRNVTLDIVFGEQAFTVCIGFDDAGAPREVFVDGPKQGSLLRHLLSDACVVISVALQNGIAPDRLGASLPLVPAFVDGQATESHASPIGMIVAALQPLPLLAGVTDAR